MRATTVSNTGVLELELEHTTCLVGECLLQGGDSNRAAASTAPVKVLSTNNLLASRFSSEPMIDMNGDPDDLVQALVWNGNRNIYCGFDILWRLDHLSSVPSEPVDFGFDQWQNRWSAQVSSDAE